MTSALAAGILAAGCAGVSSPPLAHSSPPAATFSSAANPDALYKDACAPCHDARGWGTKILARRAPKGEAELLNRVSLPPAFTTQVVRHGMGSMPAFMPSQLTDADIKALADWLEARH